ncbi:hypothetical protein [Flavobacterium beibuense]|uniref:hypothetical protein n=1 Tax=Flavobacterium beibuense TaxID=657326 RepID=UPI003A90A87D
MENPNNNLRIKVALDTQILAYLVDNTYPNLTFFIKILSECPFIDIVCSRFAIYEFIGIRKLEHYLRELVNETKKKGGTVNFSSAIKYKSEFDSPELKYTDAFDKVKESVEKELALIYDDYGIIYESVNIHNDLWKPHQDLVLSTRISKEDSLLLLSSVFPDSLAPEDYLILFTNDNQFYNALCGEKEVETSDRVFEENNLIKPYTYHLKKLYLKDQSTLNLINPDIEFTEDNIRSFTTNFILEHITEKNKKYFLGKIVSCPQKMIGKLMCFKLHAEELSEKIYVTILSNKLEYIYNHKEPLKDFHNGTPIETYPYIPSDENSRKISVEVKKKGTEEYLDENDYKKVSENGNLIFIHPDSFLTK